MYNDVTMSKFTDTIKIYIEAGKGGPGCVSFLREKYIPKGGPDGGDGGKGGDLYIEANSSYTDLSHFFKDRIYGAENGKPGMGKKMHGKDGRDLILKVPPGTQVINEEMNELICDLFETEKRVLLCVGGIGGKGNLFFKSSTNQVPRYAQPGLSGEKGILTLNLKLIADVGLVGLPNAGKSTLLSVITNAVPRIAAYPFTTLIPNLGVVSNDDGSSYKIADIPGIIKGAHQGHGLGLSFLRHIERVKVILFLIDSTEEDPEYNLQLLKAELRSYNENLLNKPYYILMTKTDLIDSVELGKKITQLKDQTVLSISSINGENIHILLNIINKLLENDIVSP